MAKLKLWDKTDFGLFCEDNFIEDDEDKFWNAVNGNNCSLDCTEKGLLTIKIQLEEH